MHIQNPLSSLLLLLLVHLIKTIIFILITFSCASYGEDEQFLNCSQPFICGDFSPGIQYPFWGCNQSPECGLPGFELRCQQNYYRTVDIASQTFRVLSIDDSNPSFTIARNDLWDNICPERYQNTELTNNVATFRYGREVEMLNLSYSCPFLGPDIPARHRFTCGRDGNRNTGFFADKLFSSAVSPLPACELNITVPVLGSALVEFRNNTSMTLQELLNQGFQVEHTINSSACSACTGSGGLCWSGTNNTIPMCLCPDGAREYICPGNGDGVLFIFPIPLSSLCSSFAIT